jgi:hypothetical protein
VGQDVRPGTFAQHEEHQYIEQPQQVNVDPADTLVSLVPLKNGLEVKCHRNILEVMDAYEFSKDTYWITVRPC